MSDTDSGSDEYQMKLKSSEDESILNSVTIDSSSGEEGDTDERDADDTQSDGLCKLLKHKDIQIFELTERIQVLQDEILTVNKIFGFDNSMSLEDKITTVKISTENETNLMNDYVEYKEEVERGEEMSDLVVKLGAMQVDLAEISADFINSINNGKSYHNKFVILVYEIINEADIGECKRSIKYLKDIMKILLNIYLIDIKLKDYV